MHMDEYEMSVDFPGTLGEARLAKTKFGFGELEQGPADTLEFGTNGGAGKIN